MDFILATAVIASLLTWYFNGRRQATDAAGYFAAVWREGYMAGVADQEYAAMVDFGHDGYGRVCPNRVNPYPGNEKQVHPMSDPLAPRHFVLAQNIKAGQIFVHGKGGKHWTALADADTTNMHKHGRAGDLLVSVPVSFRGTVQGMPLGVPLDKIVRIIDKGDAK